MLSRDDVQAYIDGGAQRCPYCNGDSPAVSGVPDMMGGCRLSQHMSCPECGSAWIEIYHLADLEEVVPYEPKVGEDPPGDTLATAMNCDMGTTTRKVK